MDQLIPSSAEEFQGLSQVISPVKSKFLKESDVYVFSANIINPNYLSDNQSFVTFSKVKKFLNQSFCVTCNGLTDIAISGIYNNSPSVKTLGMEIVSNLTENDCLIILQFNDVSPDLNQVLFIKSQEVYLSEKIKLRLEQNDGIAVILGKTNVNDPATNDVKLIFDAEPETKNEHNIRKMAFAVIMFVLLVAIGVLIYSLLNQAQTTRANFRSRRRY